VPNPVILIKKELSHDVAAARRASIRQWRIIDAQQKRLVEEKAIAEMLARLARKDENRCPGDRVSLSLAARRFPLFGFELGEYPLCEPDQTINIVVLPRQNLMAPFPLVLPEKLLQAGCCLVGHEHAPVFPEFRTPGSCRSSTAWWLPCAVSRPHGFSLSSSRVRWSFRR
jgi:hypothetical protein